MKVKGIAWAGSKSEKYLETKKFFRDVLKFKVREEHESVTIFELPNGDIFEVLAPDIAPEIGMPNGAKVDFLVDDVAEALEELKAAGIKTDGVVFHEKTQDWANWYGPDGFIYGFTDMRTHPLSQPAVTKILFYSAYDESGYLSNWYPASLFLKGKIWPSSEHYYQAQKVAGTPHEETVRRMESPRLTFEFTRRPEITVRADWDQVKIKAMHEAVYAKFTQNPELTEKLLATGDREIVENSPVDYFWGIGADGSGENQLGKVLMDVRRQIAADLG